MHLRPIILAAESVNDICVPCDARRHSVCSAVDEADLHRLSEAATQMSLSKGTIFLTEGDPAQDFFNITKGTVKLYKLLADGRQQITGFATMGHFLGLAAARTYAFSAEAIEDISLCRFSRLKLNQLLEDLPTLEKRLLATACNELASAQDQMLLLGRKSARERLASFLLGWARSSSLCQSHNMLHLPMTRTDIADYLGLTIETVSRTFSLFRRQDRIAIPSANSVQLLDRPWLQAVADGEADQAGHLSGL